MLTSSKSYGECWSPVDSIRSRVKLAKPPFQEPQKIRTRQVTASAENDNCRLCQPPQMLKVQRRKPACEQTHKKINNKNKKEVFFYACFWLVLSSITTQAAHMSYEHAWDIPGMLRHPKDIPRTRCATRAHPRSNFGKHADVKKTIRYRIYHKHRHKQTDHPARGIVVQKRDIVTYPVKAGDFAPRLCSKNCLYACLGIDSLKWNAQWQHGATKRSSTSWPANGQHENGTNVTSNVRDLSCLCNPTS